jgi:hypothetical protein
VRIPVLLVVVPPVDCERWTRRGCRLQRLVRLQTIFPKGVAVRPENHNDLLVLTRLQTETLESVYFRGLVPPLALEMSSRQNSFVKSCISLLLSA